MSGRVIVRYMSLPISLVENKIRKRITIFKSELTVEVKRNFEGFGLGHMVFKKASKVFVLRV